MDETNRLPFWLPVVKHKEGGGMTLLQLMHDCTGREGFRIMDEGAPDCAIRTEAGRVVVYTCKRCGGEWKFQL